MAMELEVNQETQKLANEASGILEEYKNYQITNNKNYVESSEVLKHIKAKANALEEQRKSLTKPLDESKRRIMDFFRKPLEYLTQAESIIKRAMLSYQQAQEELRRKEEARLQELARKEEERKRKALEERARKAEEKGDIAKAEELRQQKEEVFVPAPFIETQVTPIENISTKTLWKFKIVNESLIPRQYLLPNEKMLGEVARATKGTLEIPGVEFYCEEIIAVQSSWS